MKANTDNSSPSNLNRRQFLTVAGASAVTLAALPSVGFSADAPETKLNIGLVGCGSRGKFISELFKKHGGYNFVAAADYFQDKVDAMGEALQIPAGRRFTGLSGYKRLLEQKLDAVVIESPPYFHPEQAEAAVEAGKHVYLAKPAAVDVPGCQTIERSARQATGKKLCFLVDFQTRAHPKFQEIARVVRAGGIGKIASGEASYLAGPVGEQADKNRRADPKNSELRLRAWVTDPALSGDVIVEQNIHALDMAGWMLDAAPVSALGTGGKFRDFVGENWDHYAAIFEFPNKVPVSFYAKQFGFGISDIVCRAYGAIGTVDLHYFGKATLRSTEEVVTGEAGDLYKTGVERNIATFHESILKGDYSNPTVSESVRSNLTAILGRMATRQGRRVTWDEMLRAGERLEADLNGLKA